MDEIGFLLGFFMNFLVGKIGNFDNLNLEFVFNVENSIILRIQITLNKTKL